MTTTSLSTLNSSPLPLARFLEESPYGSLSYVLHFLPVREYLSLRHLSAFFSEVVSVALSHRPLSVEDALALTLMKNVQEGRGDFAFKRFRSSRYVEDLDRFTTSDLDYLISCEAVSYHDTHVRRIKSTAILPPPPSPSSPSSSSPVPPVPAPRFEPSFSLIVPFYESPTLRNEAIVRLHHFVDCFLEHAGIFGYSSSDVSPHAWQGMFYFRHSKVYFARVVSSMIDPESNSVTRRRTEIEYVDEVRINAPVDCRCCAMFGLRDESDGVTGMGMVRSEFEGVPVTKRISDFLETYSDNTDYHYSLVFSYQWWVTFLQILFSSYRLYYSSVDATMSDNTIPNDTSIAFFDVLDGFIESTSFTSLATRAISWLIHEFRFTENSHNRGFSLSCPSMGYSSARIIERVRMLNGFMDRGISLEPLLSRFRWFVSRDFEEETNCVLGEAIVKSVTNPERTLKGKPQLVAKLIQLLLEERIFGRSDEMKEYSMNMLSRLCELDLFHCVDDLNHFVLIRAVDMGLWKAVSFLLSSGMYDLDRDIQHFRENQINPIEIILPTTVQRRVHPALPRMRAPCVLFQTDQETQSDSSVENRLTMGWRFSMDESIRVELIQRLIDMNPNWFTFPLRMDLSSSRRRRKRKSSLIVKQLFLFRSIFFREDFESLLELNPAILQDDPFPEKSYTKVTILNSRLFSGSEFLDSHRGRFSALDVACYRNDTRRIEWLLAAGANVVADVGQLRKKQFILPVHCAAWGGHWELVRSLIEEHGAIASRSFRNRYRKSIWPWRQ